MKKPERKGLSCCMKNYDELTAYYEEKLAEKAAEAIYKALKEIRKEHEAKGLYPEL